MVKLVATETVAKASEISESLFRLQKSATVLNELSDRVNSSLLEVERILATTSIGISTYASVPITSHDPEEIEHDVDVFVAYLPTKEKVFRLALVRVQNEEEVFCKFWPECNRLDKLRILNHVPLLLNSLLGEVQKRIDLIAASVDRVEGALLDFPPFSVKG